MTLSVTAGTAETSASSRNSKPTVGLIGVGKLGTAVGRLLEAAGYPLLAWSRSDSAERNLALSVMLPTAQMASREEILRADYLILAVPGPAAMNLDLSGYDGVITVSYTHLRAHETKANLVCRLLLEKKKK